MEVSHTD